jgi:hypothetical protein
MDNVYHLPALSAKPVRRMGRIDRLQQQLLRRAELRDRETRAAFDNLTDALVMKQAEAGTLSPRVVEALLAMVRAPHV